MRCECAALYTYPERSTISRPLRRSKTSGASFTALREMHCSGGSKEFATPGCCLLSSQPSGSWGLIGPYNIPLDSKALRKAWLEECVRVHLRISGNSSSVIAAPSSEFGNCLDSHSNARHGTQRMCGHRSPDFIWHDGSIRKE